MKAIMEIIFNPNNTTAPEHISMLNLFLFVVADTAHSVYIY
jgi:hypothetical protein